MRRAPTYVAAYPQGLCAAIALNVLEFCGSMAQRDDISFVVVKIL